MAIDVAQTYIGGHTSISKAVAVVENLPFTFAMFFNARQFSITKRLIEISRNLGNPGDNYSLSLYGGASAGTVAAVVADFVLTEASESGPFSFDEWNDAIAEFDGAGNEPTAITAYLNGVAGPTNGNALSLSPDGVRRTRIFGGPSDPSTFGFNGCAARAVIFDVILSPEQKALWRSGEDPEVVAPGHVVEYFEFLDEVTTRAQIASEGWGLTEFGEGLSTCSTSPDIETDPPEEPEPEPTPASETVNFLPRLLKPYEKPPFAQFRVGAEARSNFPIKFSVFEAQDLRVTVDEVELDANAFSFAGQIVRYPGYDDSDALLADADYHRKQASVPGFRGGVVSLGTTVTDCIVTIWNDPIPQRGSASAEQMRRDLARGEFNGRIAGRIFGDLAATDRAQKLKFGRNIAVLVNPPSIDESMSGGLIIS